jgi:hypothetical protein
LSLFGSQSENLADIGDIFVQPDLYLTTPSLRHAGVGSAIARCMLDIYPDDMTAVFYDYPELNPRISLLAETYGFSGDTNRDREITYCGVKTTQRFFVGPTVNQLIQTMEQRRPWLADRSPIESRA